MATKFSELSTRLANVQEALGLESDSIIGPVSITAIENSLGVVPPPGSFSLTVSKGSIDALVGYEVTSEAFYNKKLRNPCWPGGESGVTIGIGYDLGYNTASVIRSDWGRHLMKDVLDKIAFVAGLRGVKAKNSMAKVQSVIIPLEAAKRVFFQVTLPKFAKLTRTTYPGVELLHPDAQGVLLSLIYNRGSSLLNTDKRKEMRAIKPLVAKADYAGMAQQIRLMKRLWDPKKLPGLIKRREDEAARMQNAKRKYTDDEIVRV